MPRITLAQITALTDPRSITAAKKVAKPSGWSSAGDDGAGRLWGVYQGSDTYEIYADIATLQGQCNCPSGKSPCKHVLALLMLEANGHPFPAAPIPPGHVFAAGQKRYSSGWE